MTLMVMLISTWVVLCTGFYKGGVFRFTFAINNNYPHEPPKIRCVQKVRILFYLSTSMLEKIRVRFSKTDRSNFVICFRSTIPTSISMATYASTFFVKTGNQY